MPVEKKIMLYQYDELPTEKAKDKARQWFLRGDEVDLEFTCDAFRTVCGCLGIKLDEKDPIAYSLGNSQGDHVVFSGRFAPEPDALSQIKAEFPLDEKLHKIAEAVENLYREVNGDATARLSKHHRSLRITVDADDDSSERIIREDIVEPLQEWFFKTLQESCDDQRSEETVAENIRINSYTFREDGSREDL